MIDQNQENKVSKPIVLNVRFFRKIAAEAPHSLKWFHRVISLAEKILSGEILCTLIILMYDIGLECIGYTTNDLIAGIVPGSMTAHLYFIIVQDAAFLRGERVYMILAVFGALVFASLHFRIAKGCGYPFGYRKFAVLLFAEAVFTGIFAGWFTPFWGLEFRLAFAGIVLRIGAAVFLLYADACSEWGDGLAEADRVLWAAEQYRWDDDFVLDENLSDEEWMRIMEEYREAHRKRHGKSKK